MLNNQLVNRNENAMKRMYPARRSDTTHRFHLTGSRRSRLSI
jgi:hypothetical protein